MRRVDQVEQIFFAEGPRVLRSAALSFLFLGVAVGLGVALGATNGFMPSYLWIACIGLIPAVPCWLLYIAIRCRHIATVPLVLLLCAMSSYVTFVNPAEVAKGLSPYLPILIGVWIGLFTEFVLIVLTILFIGHLWRKGAFD